MSNISQWSTSAAGNSDTPPDGWPETTMTIPQINDSARENMAAIARWYGDTQGSLVTAGTSNAYTLTTNSAHAALADQSMFLFRADRANTGAATLNVDGLGAKDMVIKGGQALESGNIVADQMVMAVYNSDQDRYEVSFVGSGTTAADLASSALGFALVNGALSASVDSNNLTVEIKTLAGNDPSAGDPVFALFRNATLSNGTFVVRRIEAATSLTIPDGATLETESNVAFRFWFALHDDNGTVRLGVSNRRTSSGISPLNEAGKFTTTAVGTGSDSAATFYTATAVTVAAPIQVIGYLEYTSGLATAGTYNNAPDIVHLRTWATKLPGDHVQIQRNIKTSSQLISSPSTFTDISAFAVTIVPTSAANAVFISGTMHLGAGSDNRIGINLDRGGTSLGLGDAAGNRTQSFGATTGEGGDDITDWSGQFLDFPGSTSSQAYRFQVRATQGDINVNAPITDTDSSGVYRPSSSISATEIMG